MKFNQPPRTTEWILNRYHEKGKSFYEFECWKVDNVYKNLIKCKAKSMGEMVRKINKFVKSL